MARLGLKARLGPEIGQVHVSTTHSAARSYQPRIDGRLLARGDRSRPQRSKPGHRKIRLAAGIGDAQRFENVFRIEAAGWNDRWSFCHRMDGLANPCRRIGGSFTCCTRDLGSSLPFIRTLFGFSPFPHYSWVSRLPFLRSRRCDRDTEPARR